MTAPDPTAFAAVIAWLDQQRLSQPAELHRRVTTLEERMSLTADQIAAVTANLENIQGDVARLNQLAIDLQGQIAAQDPPAV